MKSLRGGLIGCGFFARNHIQAWKELADVEVVAVCDTDHSRASLFAREFGVAKHYTSAVEMLNIEQLDFIDVVTQQSTHRTLVELAASR